MEITKQKIERFFSDYATRFNKSLLEPSEIDIDGVAGSFASSFIGANTSGVLCAKNDEEFHAVIPQSYAFYKSIGTKSMKITSIDITTLDEYHFMARVHWDSRYVKDEDEISIEFDVIYLLQLIDEKPRIFAYITGDEQKVLKEHGLIA
jgi:hypothetical protein